MLRGTASKVMWVGRATVFLVGLAVILAVMFGVASAAFGANGGNFILGQNNAATLVTRLAGPDGVNGAMLEVVNSDAGTDDTALSLRVQAGEPPLRVNSQTEVPKLNAQFASHADTADSATSATNADDAATLDGKSAAEFAAAYERTVVVSPTGTDTENGAALIDALTSIEDASASKPYLLYIEPGTYDLGEDSLDMQSWVDIEGSGELTTIITSGATDQEGCFPHPGTVNGADNAEMRFLTVRNTPTGLCSSAISNNSASPRLTHLTVETTGAGSTKSAIFNASNSNPTITDVTATASGGSFAYGVFNSGSSPTITDVTAKASGGTEASYGVWDQTGSSPTIRQSKLSGTTNSLFNDPAFGDGTAKVALSQLLEPVGGSSFQCFNNYNENMAPVTCP